MIKNVKSFKQTFPVKPQKPPLKSSPVLSNYHRGYKPKPPSFVPYMKDFNRRKPFRRKETFPPRRYYQKGFQKQFWLGEEGWILLRSSKDTFVHIYVDFYRTVNKIRLKLAVFSTVVIDCVIGMMTQTTPPSQPSDWWTVIIKINDTLGPDDWWDLYILTLQCVAHTSHLWYPDYYQLFTDETARAWLWTMGG